MAQMQNEISADMIERVIAVNRNSKVVKGGRRFSFGALVAVGDGSGSVGLGFGKANEVTDAISKAMSDARRTMTPIARYNTTIPFAVTAKYKGATVLLKPATDGTGVIAGGAVRAIVEAAGISDILTKNMGSNNPMNVAKATVKALDQLISRSENLRRRGLEVFTPATQSSAGEETVATTDETPSSEEPRVAATSTEEAPAPHETPRASSAPEALSSEESNVSTATEDSEKKEETGE